MNNKVISIVVILVLIAGGYLLFKNNAINPAPADTTGTTNTTDTTAVDTTNNPAPVVGGATGSVTVTAPAIKEFTVTGSNFSFAPNAISVNKGDTVKITFKNANGTHDFKIDEFNVATARIQGGQQETVTFVADKSGSFQYYCSVGTHRQMGMFGTLTVK